MVVSFWAFSATFSLLIMTYQDFKHLKIDDRQNFLMMGATMMLLTFFPRSLWYIIAVMVGTLVLWGLLTRFKAYGQGDVNTLAWVNFGLAYIAAGIAVWFMGIFAVLTLIQLGILRLMKHEGKSPLYMTLLLSFVSVCLIYGLFVR